MSYISSRGAERSTGKNRMARGHLLSMLIHMLIHRKEEKKEAKNK